LKEQQNVKKMNESAPESKRGGGKTIFIIVYFMVIKDIRFSRGTK
jgi:hypothetical protein